MLKRLAVAAMSSVILLSGCATRPPQQPINLAGSALPHPGVRIGVAMNEVPKVDTAFPGAGCLLCLAAASVANTSLTNHTHTLPADDIARLKQDVADLLRKKGQDVTVIAEPVKLGDLPEIKDVNKSPRDFSALRTKYNIDKLVMINVGELGISRSYAAYIPSGDPQGVVTGQAYLVNLADNILEWYVTIKQSKSAAGSWDEAPNYPGLSNAYFQAVEGARDDVLQPFAK